jgi:16S rRNA (guanine(966)-N(2))-methyltransferase RsmD
MRVIGGEFRSRRLKALPRQLKAPAARALRPTSDRLRETLFDMLGEEIAGKVFVDAYAGTGAVGIEALSRGAARAVFIESDRQAAAVLRENVHALGLDSRSRIIERPAAKVLAALSADIVFLDPPYEQAREYAAALERLGTAQGVQPAALVVAEHATRAPLEPSYGGLDRVSVRRQGDSSLSFYRRRSAVP